MDSVILSASSYMVCVVQSWVHHSPSLCQGRSLHWDFTAGILFHTSRRPFGFGQFYLVLITFSKNQILLQNGNLSHRILSDLNFWYRETAYVDLLCLFTLQPLVIHCRQDVSNLIWSKCSQLWSVDGRMHPLLTCWAALVDCCGLIYHLQSHWRWIPTHFQSRNPLQVFQAGWAFSVKILYSHALILMCLFSYWQMYWPTFCAICHCPVFLNTWGKDKCHPWSRNLHCLWC